MLNTLQEALKFFDRDHIRLAADTSFKLSRSLRVNGFSNKRVPRESVYDQEMIRILSNWLVIQHKYSVTGQWHTVDYTMQGNPEGKHKFLDIVIKKPGEQTIVLEFLATGEKSFIENHVEKTPEYKSRISADVAWVIHFTCEDDYLGHAYWPSDKLLNDGIYMVHIWHNADFTEVLTSACWKEENGTIGKFEKKSLEDKWFD